MTAEEKGLLDDVVANPEDMTPRLVYADWCLDNGQADRAQLIRLQMEIWDAQKDCWCGRKDGGHTFTGGQHHNGPCAGTQVRFQNEDGMWPRADHWIQLMLSKYASRWARFEEFAPARIFDPAYGGFDFQRGFPEVIKTRVHLWTIYGRRIVELAPITYVEFTDWSPLIESNGEWCWFNPSPYPTSLPIDDTPMYRYFMKLIVKDKRTTAGTLYSSVRRLTYPSKYAALRAMSEVALELAKEKR